MQSTIENVSEEYNYRKCQDCKSINVSRNISILSKKCRHLFFSSFFQLETEYSTENLIYDIFIELDLIVGSKIFDIKAYPTISMIIGVVYTSLGKMLTTETKLLTIDGLKQEYNSFKIIEYLLEIEKNDCHKLCSSLHHKTFQCPYHLEDLFTHLHLSCLISLYYVIKLVPDITTYELMKHATIALLHDIGKIGCSTPNAQTNHISYPFHGELGSGLLLQVWSPDFGAPFTQDVWEEICRTICVHMCGYRYASFTNMIAMYKLNMLACESSTVKNNLVFLSYGDHFGAIKDEGIKDVSPENFIESRSEFSRMIQNVLNIDELFDVCKFDGIIIFVRGQKHFGKSHFINKLKLFFDHNKVDFSIIALNKHKTKVDIELNIRLKKVIIIELDTLSSYSTTLLNNILPFCTQNALVISVDIIRNIVLDQHSSFNKKQLMTWIPERGFLNLKNLSSLSTSKSLDVDTKIYCKSRPKICFVIAINKYGDIGYTELFRQLEYFTSSLKN